MESFAFDISEYVKIRIDEDERKSIVNKQGKFLIKNNSKDYPIDQMNILLNNYLGAKNKKQAVPIKRIEPTKSLIWEYHNLEAKILNISVDDALTQQYFDPDVGFLFDDNHECIISMEIINKEPFDLIDIVLLRDMDENFIITPKKGYNGKLTLKNNLLKWEIPTIRAKSKEKVDFVYKINMENPKDTVKLGKYKLTFNFAELVSGMFIEDINAITIATTNVAVKQKKENLKEWECSIEFSNTSDFEMALESIVAERSEPPFICCFEYPNEDIKDIVSILPKSSWKSPVWTLESEEVPLLTAKFKFSVIPTVSYLTEYEIIKDQTLFKTNIELE
jgi:hypothetical protein